MHNFQPKLYRAFQRVKMLPPHTIELHLAYTGHNVNHSVVCNLLAHEEEVQKRWSGDEHKVSEPDTRKRAHFQNNY